MELSALSGVDLSTAFQTPVISSDYDSSSDLSTGSVSGDSSAFETALQSAVGLINETNDYSNAAEEEEIKYSLGETDNIHDLMVAQQKANVSLQYTVAVRDAVLNGYKEIMNMQF